MAMAVAISIAASATARTRAAARAALLLAAQRRNRLGGRLLILYGDAPVLDHAGTSRIAGGLVRVAACLASLFAGIAAGLDRLHHIELLLLAHNDVIPVRTNGVSRLDDHLTLAIAAHHLQSADCAHAVQVAVVQPLFGPHVINLAVEISFAEELPGEEARPLKAVQCGAGGTGSRHGWRPSVVNCSQDIY